MTTRVLNALRTPALYPELRGCRVLITGLSEDRGYDIARSFADAGCRLIIHTSAPIEKPGVMGMPKPP